MSEASAQRAAVDPEAFAGLLAEGALGMHREILRSVPGAAFCVFDTDLRFVFAEGASLRGSGIDPPRDFEGLTVREALGSVYDEGDLGEAYRAALRGERAEYDHRRAGRVHWVRVAPVRDESGAVTLGIATSIDVTAQREAEERLRRHAARQAVTALLGRRALEGAMESDLLADAAAAVAAALGVDSSSIVHLDEELGQLVLRAGPGWPEEFVRRQRVPATDEHRALLARLASGPAIAEDLEGWPASPDVLRAVGVASVMTVLIGPVDRPWGFFGVESRERRLFTDEEADFLQTVANIVWDAIERREVEEAYRHAALHDELTGLANLRRLREHLGGALERAGASDTGVAVLLLDLNDFKVINDSIGHAGGDELLCALAPRLSAAARPGDMVARIGGDEFVVVAERIVGDEHALDLARTVAAALDEPLLVGEHSYTVTASLGLAVGGGEASATELLRDADIAMYRAKRQGGGLEQFTVSMRRSAVARMRTELELRRAIERDELLLHYQPICATDDRRLLGVEALLRWEHPQRGLIPPGDFIPLAEQTGLIVPIGEWVLRAAASRLGEWRRRFPAAADLTMSVNVSARQLLHCGREGPDLAGAARKAIRENGLRPQQLALEVTESMLMDAAEQTQWLLAELKELGVQIHADDFGTGYSSLSRLTEIPLDALKIDRSFVGGLGEHAGRDAIVATIVAMASTLDLDVIAEGVETEGQLRRLASLGCAVAQGYLLSRPMPEADVAALLCSLSGGLAA